MTFWKSFHWREGVYLFVFHRQTTLERDMFSEGPCKWKWSTFDTYADVGSVWTNKGLPFSLWAFLYYLLTFPGVLTSNEGINWCSEALGMNVCVRNTREYVIAVTSLYSSISVQAYTKGAFKLPIFLRKRGKKSPFDNWENSWCTTLNKTDKHRIHSRSWIRTIKVLLRISRDLTPQLNWLSDPPSLIEQNPFTNRVKYQMCLN